MTDRNKRTLRTIVEIVIGVASAIPTVLAGESLGAAGVQIVTVAGLVTHYFHLLEKAPGFPAWLKVES